MDKVKVVLIGMTGFGNNALKILEKHPFIKVIGVITPLREKNPFPYYECQKLQDIVKDMRIPLYEGLILREEKTFYLIKTISPDLIVVSSFDQIIPENIIRIPRYGVINVHPSLLPKYRGATPTVWTLMNGEEETGVTVHFIEDEKIDSGRIIAQSKLKIEPLDNDGILRFRLAELSEKVLTDAINILLIGDKKLFRFQNESEATFYPRRGIKDATIDISRPFREIRNKIRAMTPYPGALLNYKNKTFIVKSAELLKRKSFDMPSNDDQKYILIRTLEGMMKFNVIKEHQAGNGA